MKHCIQHIAALVLGFLLLSAAGCSHDDAGPEIPRDANTVGYLSIRLEPSDGMSRAVGDSFIYGKRSEFSLAPGNHHFAVFYNDEQAAPVAIATLSGLVEREGSDKNASSTVAFAAIASRSEQLDMLRRLQECFVLLNADINADALWTMPKEQLLRQTVSSPFCKGSDGKTYFTMSNAVYVEGGQLNAAAKVDPDKVYTSYLEAIEMAWKGEAAVEACVERLAAKIQLRFEKEAYNDPATEKIFTPAKNRIILFSRINNDIPYYSGDYSYRIRITGWGMNALEQESYLFRNISPAGNYFDGWNNPTYMRAFWSEDCNYTLAVYPWQYRRAFDKSTMPHYAGQTNTLRNLSFSELNADRFNKDCIYIPENTYDFRDAGFSRTLDDRAELLAGTHVIVCADLLTDLDSPGVYRANDLYRDRNGNFYRSERDCFTALVTALNNNLLSHSFLKYTYYDWTNGGGEQTLFAKTNGEYCLYYNNTKLTPENIARLSGELTVPAEVQRGDGQRLVWMDGLSIRNERGEEVQIYSNIDEVDSTKDRWLRTATVSDIKSLLLQYIGVIDHFRDGRMYYAVPVGYVKDEAGSAPNNDKYSIYGIVRNCFYDILIHDVTGLGTSVDNDAEPIVPNKVSTHDHLFISVDILHWHEVDQDVPGAIS